MAYAFEGSKLQKLLKDMGNADLQVLVSELIPAMEEAAVAISPSGIQAGETAVIAILDPTVEAAFKAVVAKVEL